MGLGMTNGPGKTGYYAKQAYDTAAAAMAAVEAAPALVPADASTNGYMTKEYAGKLDGIAAGANNYTHPDSGVTADTYQSVTVDAKGHVTAGTKSTTFMQTVNEQGTDAATVRTLIGAGTGGGDAADVAMTGYVKPASTSAIAATDSVLDAIGKLEAGAGGILPHITIYAPTGCTITAANGGTTLTATETSGTYEVDIPRLGDWTLTCSKTVDGTPRSAQKVVSVAAVQGYSVRMSYGYMYGFRIRKTEGSPAGGVEYILDAEGMTPAHMDFSRGVFDYGSWENVWFVNDNKPCMLKNDGTVDYYLNPNDYTKKADGTDSDVANTAYAGNAMAQFPLVWIKRYEDENYWYEIVSDVQIDNTYKAYAHTRADGSIADYVYLAMFRGSGNATKMRSLSGQTLAGSLTAAQEIAGCTANGSQWYTETWGQNQLLRTLLVLMGKSRDVQTVYGTGNLRSASSASGILQTGTLKQLGQFYGYNTNNQQVKVFHCEAPWGDQWNRIAGCIIDNRRVYVKMTREGNGYRVTDHNDYEDSGVTIPSFSDWSYITAMKCSDHGMIPTAGGGSASTYFCCPVYATSGYLIVGGGASGAPALGGVSPFGGAYAATTSAWAFGCALSCEMPATA